jgi:hypothetical protein
MTMADRNSHAKDQSEHLIIDQRFREYMGHVSESLAPPAPSVERFRHELEQFLSERDLDQSVAVLCAVLVKAIEDATEVGGPKAEASMRAIVAFRSAAALLVESPELLPKQLAQQSPVDAQQLAEEGRKSGIALIQEEHQAGQGRSISATIKSLLKRLNRGLRRRLKIRQ